MTDEIPPHLTDAERGRWWTCTATETTSDVLVRRNDLRTISKLRALLAEQTARAEKAEADYRRVLSERAEANQLAGRCAQQRDQALAACAEMRAALERALGYAPQMAPDHRAAFDALLSRPDLGAGMVVVPREVVERVLCALFETPADSRTRDARIEAGRVLRDALMLDKKGGG